MLLGRRLRAYHQWKITHDDASFQGRDPVQRPARPHILPVRLKIEPVEGRPLADEPERRSRLDVPNDHLAVKVELRLLPLVLGMKVARSVFLVEYTDDDSEKDRDDRHGSSIPDPSRPSA